jgi:hypothetical protein
MTDHVISPLRQRMIEDMTVRKFTEKTQNDYIRHAEHADGRALRGTVARVDAHPRG